MKEISKEMIERVMKWDNKDTLSGFGSILPEKYAQEYGKAYVNLDNLGPQEVNVIQNGVMYVLSPAVPELFKYEVVNKFNGKEKKAFDNDLFRIPFQYMNCPAGDEVLEIVDGKIVKNEDNIRKLYKIIWNAYTDFWTGFIPTCTNQIDLQLFAEWMPQKFFPEVADLLEASVNIK